MNKAAENEQIKLFANFCNTVAAAILVTGVIGPIFTMIYGLSDSRMDMDIMAIGSLICASMSCGLHFSGRLILTGIVE